MNENTGWGRPPIRDMWYIYLGLAGIAIGEIILYRVDLLSVLGM